MQSEVAEFDSKHEIKWSSVAYLFEVNQLTSGDL